MIEDCECQRTKPGLLAHPTASDDSVPTRRADTGDRVIEQTA